MPAPQPPVLLTAFNRPKQTAVVLAAIAESKPADLYVAADGPRCDKPGDRDACRQTRALIDSVDWPCRVHRWFRRDNVGCAQNVQSAVTGVLKKHDRVIVLEDDCVATPSFFTFCRDLLSHYEHDDRFVAVSGNNFQDGHQRGDGSYYVSRFPHCWGWATWRRAWNHYDHAMNGWPEYRDNGLLRSFCQNEAQVRYWTAHFDATHRNKVDSWAFRWLFACWTRLGRSLLPQTNLVQNIGFTADGTHTTESGPGDRIATGSIDRIYHPTNLNYDEVADAYTDAKFFSGTVKPPQPRTGWISTRTFRRQIQRWRRAAA